MTGLEKKVEDYAKSVEAVFGSCRLSRHTFVNCGVCYSKLSNGNVTMDQDDYIKTLRPIVSSELTGAPPEQKATKNVTDQFVSLRGALAYTAWTQDRIKVYIVALQRVQEPTNLDVRGLNAITRELQKEPMKLTFPMMNCDRTIDLQTDSGYRKTS